MRVILLIIRYDWGNSMWDLFDTHLAFPYLSEGDTINPIEYVKKLKALKLLGGTGVYVYFKPTDALAKGGFLWFKINTLIRYFSQFKTTELTIKCSNYHLACEKEKTL